MDEARCKSLQDAWSRHFDSMSPWLVYPRYQRCCAGRCAQRRPVAAAWCASNFKSEKLFKKVNENPCERK